MFLKIEPCAEGGRWSPGFPLLHEVEVASKDPLSGAGGAAVPLQVLAQQVSCAGVSLRKSTTSFAEKPFATAEAQST